MNKYALCSSHIPLLTRVFAVSTGDVCELGTGLYSTTILKWLCELSGRTLYSYESSLNWYRHALKDPASYHKVIKVDFWDQAPIERPWGMVLVDHKLGKRRWLDIKRLANLAEYIVIHDTEEDRRKEYHYHRVWPLFKYRYEDRWISPYTTVVSNFHNLDNIEPKA